MTHIQPAHVDIEPDEYVLPQDGYFLDELNEIGLANLESDVLECPTNNVITTRYKCKVDGKWVDCTRKHCCKDYVYISGRCLHKDQDPCSMDFCEQVCTVYLQRVICTCHEGYKFKPENQKLGIKPVCVDVDECLDNNGDCQHNCINEPGSYRCGCREGFLLRRDNRTCYPQSADSSPTNPVPRHHPNTADEEQEANRDRCYANCDTVSRLHDRLKILQEKVSALSTAIKLSTMASGPPGPPGQPGPPGPQGPRGFAGNADAGNAVHGNQDYTYSLLDSGFVPLQGEGRQCGCRVKEKLIADAGEEHKVKLEHLVSEDPKATVATVDLED
ncbi:hypothetical protein QE152_g11435 [Popillia japonica]|uniref:Uncharacterized protein n=1 Tax=Popillia japonica TaxID=7064 RepID=A0AAW1LRW1_POPJA